MNTIKTYKTYEGQIREKYVSDKQNGNNIGNLYNLTSSNLRKTCLNLFDNDLSENDRRIMNNFFSIKKEEDLRDKIKKFDLDGFKPISKFLNGKTNSIKFNDTLELIAVIVDFTPRPYNIYKNEGGINQPSKKEKSEKGIEIKVLDEEKEDKGKSITPPHMTVIDKFILLIKQNKVVVVTVIVGIALLTVISLNQQRWMVWKNDHYIKVKFDTSKYDLGQLKRYKKERILDFKRITPKCDSTIFFNEDKTANLWYGKNSKGKIEYFTGFGLHPETGKTLKAITTYIIDKYICLGQ